MPKCLDRKYAQKDFQHKKPSEEKQRSTNNRVNKPKEIQETPRILSRKTGKPKNNREKTRGLKIRVYNLANWKETRTTKVQEGNLKPMEIRFIYASKRESDSCRIWFLTANNVCSYLEPHSLY